MKLSIVAFEAQDLGSLEEQVADCMQQLDAFITSGDCAGSNILSINYFLNVVDGKAFEEQKKHLAGCLPKDITATIPIAYLAQAPANGAKVSIEMHYLPDMEGLVVTPKSLEGTKYLVVEGKGGDKWVVANGISNGNDNHQITEGSDWVFARMKSILDSEGLDFSNIFRQWNYIEGITVVEDHENSEDQHYQLFNNVRSRYYAKSEFVNGYPAATGIGTLAGGVIVSFYATNQTGSDVRSIENPLQKAAFEYSDEVLIGAAGFEGFCKCTPKFARAKLVSNTESVQVYISGTASIREEKTIAEDNVKEQTRVTIDNVEKLISAKTMEGLHQDLPRLPYIEFYRVYIKNSADYQEVRGVCEERWPGVSSLYVVSDVCREKLLVEIEALASVSL